MALNDLFAEELKGPLKDFAIEVRFGDDQAETVDLRWQSRPHRSFPFLHRSRLSRQILSCNQIWRRISNSRYFEFRFLKIFDFIREFIGTFSTEVDEIQRLECTNRQISSSCEQYSVLRVFSLTQPRTNLATLLCSSRELAPKSSSR